LFGDRQAGQPQVKPVEVVTVAERPPIYHPPLPEEINSAPIEWRILSPDVMQEYLDAVEAGEEPRVAYYGLTSQGYENLSMTMGEITRYLEQILHIVGYYKDIDEEEKEE
jgi:sugar-specific transcriptional regulator TrmB